MRAVTDAARFADVLAGQARWTPIVTSWLGAELLTPEPVPLTSGRLTASGSQAVPEAVRLTVPRFSVVGGRRFDWKPDGPRHPLATFGQELQISIEVASPVGTVWLVRVARLLVEDWDDQGDDVAVTAVGMLRRAETDQLAAPTQPASGATLASEARRLSPATLAVAIDAGLADRPCPTGMVWSDDRLKALQDLADAWPALLRNDEWGQAVMRPPLGDVPVPVLTLRDGERGTVLAAPTSDTRAARYNRVIASSSAPDFETIAGVADITGGPMAVGSEYGVVSRKWSSPLLTTVQQAQASARTILARSALPATSVPVQCAPDPRIELDDAVEVLFDGTRVWGWVTAYDMPLTVSDGAMRVDVGRPGSADEGA